MSGQNPQQENDESIKVMVFTMIGIMIAIWFLSQHTDKAKAFAGILSWLHLKPFALAAEYLPFLQDIPFFGAWFWQQAVGVVYFLEQGGYAHMPGNQLTWVLGASGKVVVPLYIGPLIWFAMRGANVRPDEKFRQLHDIESMIWQQSMQWTTTRMVRKLNPLKMSEINIRSMATSVAKIFSGAKTPKAEMLSTPFISIKPSTWQRSLRPEEWALANGLSFDQEFFKYLESGENPVRDMDYTFRAKWDELDLDALMEILALQLRSPWVGPKDLKPSLRAVYAVMALFYDYDTSGGNKLLNDIGILAGASPLKPGSMDKALRGEVELMQRIDAVCNGKAGAKLALLGKNHAYVESAFPTFLHSARKDRGVLPSAAFLWLKSEDRLMWYILNNVGNEAVMCEAAGAMAHNKAELQMQCRIHRPAVYQAARGILEDYFDVTPERLEARRHKAVMRRTPGQQMELERNELFGKPEY